MSDNDAVTEAQIPPRDELPPPTGDPVGVSDGEPDGTRTFPRRVADWFATLPLGDAREAADWWFGPIGEATTWAALGYLLAGALLGPLWFGVVVVLLGVSLPLVVLAVGVPMTVLSFTIVGQLATLERVRASWVGAPIPPRPLAVPATGAWGRFTARLRDPARWRQVGYFACLLVVGPLLFVVGLMPWVLLVQAVVTFSLGGIVVAVLLAGLAGRVTALVGTVAHSFVAWFLGPDRTAELEARVDTLTGQRQDILDAVSAERRRIERNLHDGVQQQLVALGIDIGRAAARLEADPDEARQLLDDARNKVRASIGELRTIGRGLHPAVLDDRGLDAALSAVVAGAPIPIEVNVDLRAVPVDVAETAYYVANEAVANVLKHARARSASIRVTEDAAPVRAVRLVVHDDGRGGACIDGRTGTVAGPGSGLAGMAARVRAADGFFEVVSPTGGPTTVTAVLPLGRAGRQDG